MTILVLRRIATLAAMLLIVSALVFFATNLLPGDPAAVMLGTSARPDTLTALRAQLGLDQPAPLRFLLWLGGLLQGDLGRSITYDVPVSTLLLQRLALTVPLALLALALAVALGLALGFEAALRRDGKVDRLIALFAQLGLTLPNFWIGILLILFVTRWAGVLPAGGFPGWDAGIATALASLALPALALALPQAAVLVRVTRTSLLETMQEDFIRTALSKGLSQREAIRRHALPNALIPVLTVIGLQFSFLAAGTILVENVFALPGLGQLAYQALVQRDLVVLQGVTLFFTSLVVLVNAAVDLAYLWVDPRLRSEG